MAIVIIDVFLHQCDELLLNLSGISFAGLAKTDIPIWLFYALVTC